MKIPALFIILMGLFISPLSAQTLFFEQGVFKKNGDSLPYRILFPKDYSPNKEYPLLLFLHGAGERGNDNERQLIHGSTQFLNKSFREKHPAIIVFPQCPKKVYWANVNIGPQQQFSYRKKPKDNPLLELVEELLASIEKQHKIDSKRIYVGGLSMGGMGTFELVYRNPRKFAAAFAICGGAHPQIARKIRRPMWRIDHGVEDKVVPISHSEEMVIAMKKQRINVIFNRYQGVYHNSWNNVFADSSFLPWLFAQSQ